VTGSFGFSPTPTSVDSVLSPNKDADEEGATLDELAGRGGFTGCTDGAGAAAIGVGTTGEGMSPPRSEDRGSANGSAPSTTTL
jgi:hypothetical protein